MFIKSTTPNTKQKSLVKLNILKYKNLTNNKPNNKLLQNLRFLFASSLLTLSLNVSSSDALTFNKDTYLDLNKPYANWNNTQSYTKKDNQANKFLKQVSTTIGNTVHSAISSTNSDNANQLGNKIKDQLKNQAINNAESLVNNKANEYANSIGNGKTEISLRKLTSKNPDYSLKTIQPLTSLNDDSTEFTFVQAQLNSGENFGNRRSTFNFGIGYRQRLEQGKSIAGVNLFTDYETKSEHKRGSIGLEYQRANFNLNVNKYFPLSDKKIIGDYTEESLAGHDIKFSGQAPYLPWAKVKATRYIWEGVADADIKGTTLGVEVQVSDSVRMELGSEDNNTINRKTYARLTTALPLSDHESLTNFRVSKKAFQNSGIVNLSNLEFVERSNKIRIEKHRNAITVVLGVYNAPTTGATCTLYDSAGVALGAGLTKDEKDEKDKEGQVNLAIMSIPAGLVSIRCVRGFYIDEATGITIDLAPTLRAAVIYPGTGSLTLLASPLSEIAYRLASVTGDLAKNISAKNTAVATAFSITGVNITSTIPTNIRTTKVANDDAGKFAMALAVVSQMGENSNDPNPTVTIDALVTDMADGDIDGRNTGSEIVNVMTALNNFRNGAGDNNNSNGKGANNIIGVTNSTTKITLIEGEEKIYTVALNVRPSNDVTITPMSKDRSIATVSGAMTFTSVNWSVPQVVTVTAVTDTDTTNETVTIGHTIRGANYRGVISAEVIAEVTDNTIGMVSSLSRITLTEGTTRTYTVALNTQPTGNVTITPNSGDTGAVIVSGTMTFTSANWSTAQTVTVTSVDDDDANNESVTITHQIAGSDYANATSNNVTVTVTDNDTIRVTNSTTAITLDENATNTYTVVLNTQPTGDVTVTPNSNDINAVIVSGAMTFTSANWSIAQTVTVRSVDDNDANNESVTITYEIAGANYAGTTSENVTVTVTDNDTAGVTNSTTATTLGEGKTNTYTVVLNTQPTSNVTITPNSDDTGAATVSGAMTFTSANWDTPQTVLVTGAIDADTNNESVTITHEIKGIDYASVTSSDVTASVTDKDTAGVINSVAVIALNEGETSTYTVVLNMKPTGNVTITPNSDDTGAVTVSGAMTFTHANWSMPQMVTVTGANDVDTNKESVTITHAIAGANYASATVSNVTVTVTDKDTVGVTNSASIITLGEGKTNTYTVVLNTQPTGNVTITPNSGDTDAVTVSGTMTFTSTNWDTPQTVTVTGVADADATNENVTITHDIEGADYANVVSANVVAKVIDDTATVDTAGVSNSTTAITLDENTTNTYTVVLNTQPTGNVTITPNSSNTSVATVSGIMTFTSANWDTSQTVTVTGVVDADATIEKVTITHDIAGADYASITSENVIATVIDKDIAKVTNSTTAITLVENATNTYTVVLNTQPTGDVTITPNSNDTGAATVSNAMIFTRANWNIPQTVTVTGIDDTNMGNETVTITHTISGADYANVSSSNVSVSVTDNDLVFNNLDYSMVVSSHTGRVWLDRNLGASQACISSTDAACYGDLYQWGRAKDGHESRTSGETTTRVSSITPTTNEFITSGNSDWTTTDTNGTLRTASWANGGANDICPAGFSVPTEAELTADTINANITGNASAFSSFLRIPVASYRSTKGTNVSGGAYLWSRSASGVNGRGLNITATIADFNSNFSAHGFSVRCIRD